MKYKSQNRGITLVALVITVVVMLILAGVAISAIINGDGIFNRTTQAEREHVKSNILEVVDMAELDLTIENAETGKKIDINSLIEKIKEISSINEEDYIISVDEEEQSATIVDKKTNVVVDIWIDENGNINKEGSIVDDIADVAKPTITYELNPPAGTYGEEVKITIIAKEENKGIAKIEFQGNVETCNGEKEITKEYIVTENGTYKVTVEGTNGRKASINIEVNNIMSAGSIILEAQNTTPTKEDVSVKIVYDENIKVGGQALTNADRFQYSIGENNWQTTTNAETTISVGVNGTVYARYYDGTQGYKTTSITIQNIDKIEPTEFDLSTTSTTNSITVSGQTEDTATAGCATENYGIRGYQYKLSSSTGEVLTNWTTETAATSYTFNNLTQGETYQVSMRAVDKAGNITEATNKDTSVTLSTIADSSAAIGISYNPTTPTKGNVQVTFTNNSEQSGLTLKYQKDSTSGSWIEYTEPITMETNGKVYARLFDENEQYTNTATATVDNIDKVLPNTFNLSTTKTTNSITVSGSTTDTATAGCATNNYGITGYQFQLKNSAGSVVTSWTTTQTSGNYTFNNLTQGETYQVSMRAIDKAGNTTEATNKDTSVTLSTVADSSTKIGISYSTTAPTKGNVKVTFTNNSGDSGLTLKYQKGSTSGTWTTYTEPVEMTTNGKIYARLFDNKNQYKNTATGTVENIDKVLPNTFNLSTTKTTNSITVSGSTTDTATAGCATKNYGIAGYQFQLKNSAGSVVTSWTTTQTSGNYTFNNLTQGTTYKVSMRAVDKAGNIREATNKDTSVVVNTVADSSAKIGISYSTTVATKGNVKVTFTNNSGDSGLTLKYQIGSTTGTWTTYTEPVEMTTNGKIYARLFDNKNQYKNTATGTVENIDKVLPNTFNLSTTKTTNSITVSGSTTDTATAGCATKNYGIAGYQFQLKNSAGSVVTSWTTAQTSGSYTFSNLTQGTTYKVSMRAVDKAGNIREATNKDNSVVVNTVADSSAKIGISYSTTAPTKGNVQVTFINNSGDSGLTLKYQIGSTTGTWTTYTEPVEMTTNGKIYARLFDNKNQYKNTATGTVENIDKVLPNTFNLSTTKTTNSITVSGSTTDTATAGCATKNYGIAGYQFQLKDSAGSVITSWTTAQTSGSYTFSNLTQGTTYKVSMRAVDKAENIREATNKDTSVVVNTVADSSAKIGISYSTTAATKGNVKVTFTNNSGDSGLTLKYQKGSTTGTWTTYTGPVEMTTNGKIYARLFDNKNQYKNTATGTVQNIDKVVPVISSVTASTSWGKTNSVTIKATDTGTSGCASGNIGIVGYGINKSSTTAPAYTTVTATTSLNTTVNVSANGTYYVWVKDKAGNTANKQVIVNRIDTTAPTTATIASSNVEETTFTLTAKGADGQSGIAKYEFYLNGKLEKTITTTSGTATYNVTGKTGGQSYKYKVRVYDKVGLYKDSSEITVTTVIPVKVGDYVNYDAGIWTEADFTKITSSAGNPTVNKSEDLPINQGEFGGFIVGQSRNNNSTPYLANFTPDYSGWRVWDIDESTGEITLISAGHPESYYHSGGEYAKESVELLKNRDCSMYENQYAKSGSAHILTGQEAAEWYNKQFGTNYEIKEYRKYQFIIL